MCTSTMEGLPEPHTTRSGCTARHISIRRIWFAHGVLMCTWCTKVGEDKRAVAHKPAMLQAIEDCENGFERI